MRIPTRALARRIKGLEAIKEQQKLGLLRHQRGSVMAVGPIPSLNEWEKYAVMQQEVLINRARHEGPIPDEEAFPYSDEYLSYTRNRKIEYIA